GGDLTVTYGRPEEFDLTVPKIVLPPIVRPPPRPTVTAHEVVQLEIPQQASLERQAFLATLKTTNTSGVDLADFRVTIKVADLAGSETNAAGQRYVDLFAITAPVEGNYGPGHAIATGQTAQSEWTLIPAPGLGGAD